MDGGFFIVFEGPDGSGKSTQVELLHNQLTCDGYSCIITQEPGGTKEGKSMRDIILNPELSISSKTELFLFLADRSEHVHKIIQPALKEGKVVICSRYFYSTLVYQGIARKVASLDFLKMINLFAVNDIVPNIVFYLDVVPELGLTQAKDSSSKVKGYSGGDRIEREGTNFQKKVREGYLKLASQYKDTFVIVEESKGIKEVSSFIYLQTKRRLQYDRDRKNREG